VTHLYGCQAQGWTNTSSRIGWTADSAERSAGSDSARGRPPTSMPPASTASRDPLRMPFAAYPLHPVACARLIGDIAIFTVEMSGPALAESVSAAGIPARWVWAGTGDIPRRGRHGDDEQEVVTRTRAARIPPSRAADGPYCTFRADGSVHEPVHAFHCDHRMPATERYRRPRGSMLWALSQRRR
jgi:hypothetical protein